MLYRPADIKTIAVHYLALHAARAGTRSLELDPAALRHLVSYTFPGAALPASHAHTFPERSLQSEGCLVPCLFPEQPHLLLPTAVNIEEVKTIMERVAIQARAAQEAEAAAAPAALKGVPGAKGACSGKCSHGTPDPKAAASLASADAEGGCSGSCGCKSPGPVQPAEQATAAALGACAMSWEEEEAPAVLSISQSELWFATQASRLPPSVLGTCLL